MKKIKMLSLFSGVGAPEVAIKELGFDLDVVNYCEIDKFASTSYSAIHNESEDKNLKDVRDIDGKNFKNLDLIFHGSPCQSYSNVGLRDGGDKGSGTKSSLMWETVRIVEHAKPKVVIWENVASVLNKTHIHNFNLYLDEMQKLGYSNSYKVISPRDIGEAQSRKRVFVVSTLQGVFNFSEYEKPKTIKPIGNYLEENIDPKHIVPYATIYNFEVGHPSFASRLKIKRYTDLAECLVAKSGRAARTNNYLLYNENDYDLMDKGWTNLELIENNIPIRALTPLEYWRLQGFDDSYYYKAQKAIADKYKKGDLEKADAQMFKQCGNSIHVGVLKSFIGDVLENHV